MQNQFLYLGIGQILRKAAATTANQPLVTNTIANGEYSESVAAHDCKELLFALIFAAAATGTFVIERSSTPDFATSETHSTVTVTASLFVSWPAGETLLGYYRVKNNSGQNATIYHNKRIA